MTDAHQPTKGYRTFVLILLTVVYGFNFIDRQIVGILAPFIQEDLNLTNTELGLLIGLAFAIFYTTVAIPIAWLADRYNRVNILIDGSCNMEWVYSVNWPSNKFFPDRPCSNGSWYW